MELEFAFQDSNLTANEMRIIRIFFNVSAVSADEVYALGDGFVLEENEIHHVGLDDKLFVLETGFIVRCELASGTKDFMFQRNQQGLLAALLRLVDPEAEE